MIARAEPQQRVPGTPQFQTVLVDTSLLVEQQKQEKYAAPVRECLACYQFRGASSYSKLEFKRAWVQKLGYIHRICRDPHTHTMGDVLDWIERRLANHPKQKRRLQTCLQALAAFLDRGPARLSHRAQVVRLEAHCKRIILDGTRLLDDLVTAWFKGTGCVRAEEPPTVQRDGSLNVTVSRCNANRTQCGIAKFFAANEGRFGAIADCVDGLSSPSQELGRIRDQIRQAQRDPQCLCSDEECKRLADALIAVDGFGMDAFAANNPSEWEAISSALGKCLVNPVSSSRSAPL